jgi:PAS domain S-box-containing protein
MAGGEWQHLGNRDFRAQVERALHNSRHDLDRAQAVARTGSWRLDIGRNELTWSAETCRIFGISPDTPLTYETFLAAVHPDDRAHVEHAWKAALTGAPYDIEHRIAVEGETKWVRERAELEFDAAGKLLGGFGTVQDITDKKQAEEQRNAAEAALRRSEARLSGIVSIAADAIISTDDQQRIILFNEGAEAAFGFTREEVIGEPLGILLPERFRDAHARHIRQFAASDGTARRMSERGEIYGLHKDGHEFPAEAAISNLAIGGERILTVVLRDITGRKRAEEKIQLLLHEVNHRAKNMLSLVQVIARQTAASDSKEFAQRFSERIAALAASQDLLVKNQWQSVSIDALVRSQLAHITDQTGGRISLEGPPLRLTASAAQAIGMALHELATNASKYGALSNGVGRVEIAWGLSRGEAGAGRFTISWTERGGPPVMAPTRRGFGWTVIACIPKMQLDAEIALDYAPAGLSWRLECPIAEALDSSGADEFNQNPVERTREIKP